MGGDKTSLVAGSEESRRYVFLTSPRSLFLILNTARRLMVWGGWGLRGGQGSKIIMNSCNEPNDSF